jgi:hypothetical protein
LALATVILVAAGLAKPLLSLSTGPLSRTPGAGEQTGPTAGGDSPAPRTLVPAAPLQVLSIDIEHYARLNDSEAVPRGILGKQSFTPRLGDQVTIDARLTRPAYCFLLAFRPDGVAELCFPESDAQPPQKTDRVRVPSRADARYGLQEGTGLWVFGVVASHKPLPAYRDVVAQQPPAWSPPAATADADHSEAAISSVVWWYDGELLDALTASGKVGIERANSEEALGNSGEIVRAIDSLKIASRAEAAAAIGLYVSPLR